MNKDGNNQSIGHVENSVVIQICQYGSVKNTASVLGLDRFEHLRNKAKRDIDRLNPKTRGFRYIRSPIMGEYENWLSAEDSISIKGLIGGAGAGKTRFALELCDYAAKNNWQAGFIDRDELLHQHSQMSLSKLTWQYTKPTLIVVDYAAGLQQALKVWLDALILETDNVLSNSPPLRILLLERTAHSEFGWWGECFDPNRDDTLQLRFWLGSADGLPDTLPGIEDDDKKRELIQSSLKALGSVIQVPQRSTVKAFDKALAEAKTTGQPLYLIMAAMVASGFSNIDGVSDIGLSAALSLGRTDLADKVAEHEITRLKRVGAGNKTLEMILLRLTAVITLMQGIKKNALPAMAEAEITAQNFNYPCDQELVSTVIQQLGEEQRSESVDDLYIPPILPDIVGEAFILKILGDKSLTPHQISTVLLRAANIQQDKVTDCIFRIVQDYAAHPEKGALGLQLADVLIDEGEKRASINVLLQLSYALPKSSLVLMQRSVRIAEMLVSAIKTIDASDTAGDPLKAYGLHNLAVRLSATGQREAALVAAQETVVLYRKLVEHSPQAYFPGLASSMNNLAIQLSGVGQREAALVAAQEAVSIRRALAEHSPQAYLPDLATSVNSLANRLSKVGQRESAVVVAQEAVVLYRELAEHSPQAYLPDLAMSVSNLASFLSKVGQREAALVAAQEAVSIRRELAEHTPQAYLPDLAGSVNNLASFLSKVGQREAALVAAQEAVVLYRELAEHSPQAYLPDLAMSVNNLANQLSEAGQREAALVAAQEAVSIRRELAEHSPQAYLPDLAGSVNNLANRLSEVGQREAALVAAQEAVVLYRKLVEHSPQAYLPDLAMSLGSFGQVLQANHKHFEASEAFKEGCYILQPLLDKSKAACSDLFLALFSCYIKICEQEKLKPAPTLLSIHEQFFSGAN